jgi:hypothetical protein
MRTNPDARPIASGVCEIEGATIHDNGDLLARVGESDFVARCRQRYTLWPRHIGEFVGLDRDRKLHVVLRAGCAHVRPRLNAVEGQEFQRRC